MSHYVVGDIQGCHAEFQHLLDVIAFDPADHTAGWVPWTLGSLQPRILHRATLLPTGDVLVTGGVRDVSDAEGVRNPQLGYACRAQRPQKPYGQNPRREGNIPVNSSDLSRKGWERYG